MDGCAHLVRMADYNRWMNDKVYAAAARLPTEALAANRGAFFGSILGTLNHLMVADLIWLRRFALPPTRPAVLDRLAEWPVPTALDQILYPEFAQLGERRLALDALICDWASALTEADLDCAFDYRNTRGVAARRHFGSVVFHLFNHQTHHRGQVTTLLTQAGADVGPTDLLLLIPDELAT